MKKNIITLSLILLSVVCFAQEMESKWYAGLSSKFKHSSISSKTDYFLNNDTKLVKNSVFVSPYIARKISKHLDVGVSYELFRRKSLREFTWFSPSSYNNKITAHTVSYFNRLKLIQRKRLSLDLMGFVGLVQQRRKRDEVNHITGNRFDSVSPWERAISGRGTIGVNYDLGTKWRIRLAKDFLEYGQDNFDGINEFTFLHLLDSVYFVVEYRF